MDETEYAHFRVRGDRARKELDEKMRVSADDLPKMCTLADDTQKVATDLKPGDIFVSDGRRYEVEQVFEDGLDYHDADRPKPCPACGQYPELNKSDEMPF